MPEGGILMFYSGFAPTIEEMLLLKHRAGVQMKFIGYFLEDFDQFCVAHYPNESILTKEIGENWIHNSESTSFFHMARRVQTVVHLGSYQRSIGLPAYVPQYRIRTPKAEEPHLFTDEQLAIFFNAVDTMIIPTDTYPYKDVLFPVFFRMVYCCRLRCSEACNLRVEDVDLQRGAISIYRAKGNRDRELLISDDLRDLCIRFDHYYSTLIPNRQYFFQPSVEREHMVSGDVSKIFDALLKKSHLDKIPGKKFSTHGLRHLFAVQNIRKCTECGEDFYNWMQYLCKYMGHKHIRYTLYYLHITSQLFPVYQDQLRELTKGIGVVYAEE